MAKVRIDLNRRGVAELLKSRGVLADVTRRARSVAVAAGPGMEASSMVGRTRARASVITTTHEARQAAEQGRLTAALNAGRG